VTIANALQLEGRAPVLFSAVHGQKLLFAGFQANSDLAITFSHPDFLKESNSKFGNQTTSSR